MKGYGHWALVASLGLWAMVGTGCETRRYTIEFEKHYPSVNHRTAEHPGILLQVEDAISDDEFKRAQNFLGEDILTFAHFFIIPMNIYVNYSADQPRNHLVSSALQARFTAAGLPIRDLSVHKPGQFDERSQDALSLSVRVTKLAVTTSFASALPMIFFNIVGFEDKQVNVVLECQLTQPGNQTALWKGTVSGSAESEELKNMEETARANIKDSDAWMVHEAISRAVSAFLTQSQAVRIGARLRNETFAKAMTTARDTEADGNLRAALSQYGRAYRVAGDRAQSLTVIQTVADTIRKLPTKPEISEEARRYGVQATTQAEQKHYSEALALFSQSLEAAPWWAEGHFNRALLFANQERYQDAVTSMQHFLVLAPNAPDARAAQDKIYEWELKAK